MASNVTSLTLADKAWEREAQNNEAPENWLAEQAALEFAAQFGSDWRYVDAWGYWLHWNGRFWKRERTQLVIHHIRGIIRQLLRSKPQRVSGNVVAVAERLAQTTREVARDETIWDTDPWLLNCVGGTLDLRTGQLRPHSRDDHLTKMAKAMPAGDCPLWKKFLDTITGADLELQGYLQRIAGYCLTGDASEQVFFFAHGDGRNGKSTFINTLLAILDRYARQAAAETFMMARGERHPTELAGLYGYRLVAAVELPRGARWNESRLKALTGGERVTARFMRQDEFEYQPQLKLLIAGNHQPKLGTVDEAMRGRLHLLPFKVKIEDSIRDKRFTAALLKERNGILAWAVEGCRDWQRQGLDPPAAVVDATGAYFDSQDTIAQWLEECCVQGPNLQAASKVLFTSWKRWCEANGEEIGPRNDFSQALRDRGFEHRRGGKAGRRFSGLALVGFGGAEARGDAE